MPSPLILASTSAYRRELLSRLRLSFEIAAPGVDEAHVHGETAPARAARLALAKATAIADRLPDAVVIGSDQVAVCGELVLDKPGDAAGCRAQLQLQSGRSTVFYTAVAVLCRALEFKDCFSDITTVQFRQLSNEEIDRYIAHDQPLQCAGSFRSESLGVSLFAGLGSADPTGLVGLPLIRLTASLRSAGFLLP